ncbi:DUF2569 domain-containing protein [Mucilaginibacter sp. PAMB04168]|uniref:DUF2569 domain-containing protein n=1 Tax=Mucilaginibacter sp. PAMB04168 TaxID=3138567 RepID=UPI0031F62FB3
MAVLINNDFLNLNQWHTMASKSDWSLGALLVFEAVGNVFLLCYAAFCFVLLVNRRDILPNYITGLYIFVLVFTIADYAVASMIGYGSLDDKGGSGIFRAVLAASIWIPYFQRSARVHRTFIVPYPASNYAYEQPATTQEKPAHDGIEQAEESSI